KQRVAIARALVTDTGIILCDEPTASLDAKSASQVMKQLKDLASTGKAVVVVTHDLRLRQFADRIIYVEEGVVSDRLKHEEYYKKIDAAWLGLPGAQPRIANRRLWQKGKGNRCRGTGEIR